MSLVVCFVCRGGVRAWLLQGGRPALLLPPALLFPTPLDVCPPFSWGECSPGWSWEDFAPLCYLGGACIPALLLSPQPWAAPASRLTWPSFLTPPGPPCHLLWCRVLCVAVASLLEECWGVLIKDCGRPAFPLPGRLLSRSCGCCLGLLCCSHGLLRVRYHGTSPA